MILSVEAEQISVDQSPFIDQDMAPASAPSYKVHSVTESPVNQQPSAVTTVQAPNALGSHDANNGGNPYAEQSVHPSAPRGLDVQTHFTESRLSGTTKLALAEPHDDRLDVFNENAPTESLLDASGDPKELTAHIDGPSSVEDDLSDAQIFSFQGTDESMEGPGSANHHDEVPIEDPLAENDIFGLPEVFTDRYNEAESGGIDGDDADATHRQGEELGKIHLPQDTIDQAGSDIANNAGPTSSTQREEDSNVIYL